MGRESRDLVAQSLRRDNSLCLNSVTAQNLFGNSSTHNFIDSPLVGVEIESKAGVAIEGGGGTMSPVDLDAAFIECTHYFSMSTREALFTVFVRTRPYLKHSQRQYSSFKAMNTHHLDAMKYGSPCLALFEARYSETQTLQNKIMRWLGTIQLLHSHEP